MNPRQRRGALLMVIAVIGALAVFVTVAQYVAEVNAQLGPMRTVLAVGRNIPAYAPIAPDALVEQEIPERWAPPLAFTDPLELAGFVASTQIPRGSILSPGMLVPAPTIEPGQREIAILIDAETGVAGRVGPGDRVDIVASFPGTETTPPYSAIVVQGARVIARGDLTEQRRTDADTGLTSGQVVPITFALSVEETLRVAYVESFAETVRLALREPTDQDRLDRDQSRFDDDDLGALSTLRQPVAPTSSEPEPQRERDRRPRRDRDQRSGE